MKKKLNTKSDVSIKKKVVILSGLLVLSLIIFSSIAIADPGSSENNKISYTLGNVTNLTDNSPKLKLAPENPEFVKYQENTSSSKSTHSLDGQETGLVPSPVDFDHLSYIPSADISTPTYYDLRTQNRVTPVKNQGKIGVCWIFATYGSLESYLKPGENWDFSENNLKNLLITASPEGFDINPNSGGNLLESTAYLARWSGPVAESDDPYYPYSLTSPQNLPIQKHVQDILIIPGRKAYLDNNDIKVAVQNYGAVFTTMYYNNFSYSPTNCSYYFDKYSSSNHVVDIVGWNDSFDKNRFSVVPPGDGAFIVKNSWGTAFGENGYFYVSYYDSNIGQGNAVFTAENPDNYKFIYQYDPLGLTSLTGYTNPTGWCANVFTAKSDEILKAVSVWTIDSNSNYEIYIYTNPGSGPTNQFGPVLSKSGTISAVGYHTIPLGSGVQLKAGQKFSVVLRLTTPLYNTPIAIERPIKGWSSKAKANAGESFVSPDGVVWTDITMYYPNTNACIKAFTVP